MRTVVCQIDYIQLPGDYTDREGNNVSVPSVRATCEECGHETESFGQHERSVRRCLALMREGCPNRRMNIYRAEDRSDEE